MLTILTHCSTGILCDTLSQYHQPWVRIIGGCESVSVKMSNYLHCFRRCTQGVHEEGLPTCTDTHMQSGKDNRTFNLYQFRKPVSNIFLSLFLENTPLCLYKDVLPRNSGKKWLKKEERNIAMSWWFEWVLSVTTAESQTPTVTACTNTFIYLAFVTQSLYL